jgi:hypothetical protein
MIVSLNSGGPYNRTTGFDNNGDTVPNDRPLGIGRNTGAGPGYASVDLHLSKRIRFAGGEGKGGGARPAARLAGRSILNLGGERPEGRKPWLEVSIDAFNVFNRVNFKNYIGTQSSPFYGRSNAANPARQVQFSMKFHF